ncbi:thiamine-phosphate kinase [Pseudoxanthomonas sp. X-1]|uniref:thiamine-phosphate kinase n=1 Tax=Pseudoxanthomonas sp. X-1 TaxID=2571115 RepID=UPI00110B6E1C|nr:thiamine-phosphate kinase [Pseudoxanthomonas sp. X-1]TMN19227.1 thiamine-phosphate kinase [Pseudoxanthomonas sp. X-1]UAY74083.1 thiamine-phosphate kinase [Pseudoxanthomonas sp. X-1]
MTAPPAGSEFGLIARIHARAGTRGDVVLGIGDDAALLAMPPGTELVVTADTLNAGVHFFPDVAPADLGWKALAVNLSDLAAMGARPAWCTLSLSLPQADPAWIEGFLDGFCDLAARHGIALVGGDTTRGPLSVSITAMGQVEAGHALRRDGARVGDEIWVTGTPGDAAAALQALLSGAAVDRALRARLDRPTPRVEAGRGLLGVASACVDISDGLLADLGHLCRRSGVGAQVQLEQLPVSRALAGFRPQLRWAWQAGGGDDYELCFTAAPQRADEVQAALDFAGVPGARIGRIVSGQGVQALDAAGAPWQAPRVGYDHFG